jgi:hypothetical protein
MMPTANTSAGALETFGRIVGVVFHQIDHRKIVVYPASTTQPQTSLGSTNPRSQQYR